MAEDKSKQTTDGEGQRKIPPVADRLVTYAVDLERWPLFVDQHGEEHTFLDGQALPISRANQALTKLLYDYETKAPSNDGLIGARRVLEMLAANSGEVRELHTRAAFFEGCVYYELRPGRTVKISEGGWDFDPDPSVYFRAIKNLKPLPDPVRGGRLEDLLGWTNLKTDRDRRLYLTYVTLVGMAHLQRYILQTTGVMGSGKTTASRLIKRLMDPTANEAVSPDKRDFLQKAAHCFVLMLDNQTTLPDWFQTTLSRLVTGESDSKRRLYTDDEDHVWSLQRAILLNGINPPGENSDLQDRSLPIELNRIQAEERLGEDDFWMQFELKQPELLGGVFDALALALKYRHRVTLDRKPRLASWGDYAVAVYASRRAEASPGDRSLWTEQDEIGGPELFKRDWGVVEETQQQGTLDGSIVAQAVIAFMRDRDRVELPAAKLYREIEDDVGEDLGLASDRGWPRSPRTLWREIKEVTALLQSRGIYASRGTSKRLGQPIVLSSDSCGEDDGPGGPDPGPGAPNGDSKTTQNGGGDKSSFGGDNLQSGGDNLGGKIDYPPQERPIGTPEASFGGDGGDNYGLLSPSVPRTGFKNLGGGGQPESSPKISPPSPPDGVTAQNTTDLEGVLTTDEEAREVVEWLRTLDSVALDIETYGTNLKGGISHATDDATSYLRGVVRLVAFHGSNAEAKQGRLVDMHGVSDGMLAEMLRAIEGKPKYLHNALFDLPRLYRRCGVLLKREVYDTLIAARAARAGETESDGHTKLDYDLGAALERELGVKVDKNIKHKWGEPLTPERIDYVANDVAHLEELHKALVERMEWHDVLERYEVIRSTLPTFLEAAVAGVPVDEERLEELTNSARDERDRFLEKLNAVAPEHPEGGKWTWNSQKNTGPTGRGRNGTLRAFSVCGVELGDVQYRTLWDHRNDHPVVAAYLDYKGKKEEYAAYRKWLPEYSEDGRLYPQPKVAGAVTSRLLYSKPNVQGVAKRKMEGYRKAVAPPKGRCIVAGDFEQQELRIAAVISGDRKMQRVFIEGKDVYLATASKMVGEEITDKKHPARAGAKRATLGFAYGMGIDKYIENTYKDHGIHLDKRQAQNDRKAFQKAFPGFHRWQQEYGKADDRETRSILGWRRVVKAWDNGGGTLEPAYNERINGRVQSTAGDILYLALVKMQNDPHPDAQFLMGVHDEVVLEAPEESAEEVALWLHAKMVEAFEEVLGPDLGGEQSVEVGYGPSWGEQQDVELPEDKAA